MQGEINIELKGLRFLAHHGLYAEEKKLGNEFEVNLTVIHLPVSGTITDLGDTINYVALYDLLKTEMQKPRELLETFVMEFAETVHLSFPQVKKIDIAITKLHPPIPQFIGKVEVKYSKNY